MSFFSKSKYFIKNHPVFFNFVAIVISFFVLVWLVDILFLRPFSRHGEEVVVPQVKGLKVDIAAEALRQGGFEVELDSISINLAAPGTVVNQSPRENSYVKPGRTIYLRYVCFMPRKLTVPAYYGMSQRMAIKAFNEAGITNISIREIPSQDPDLVLAVKYNGQFLAPGKEIPANANIVIEVGRAIDAYDGNQQANDSTTHGDSYEELILPEDDDARFIENLELEINE